MYRNIHKERAHITTHLKTLCTHAICVLVWMVYAVYIHQRVNIQYIATTKSNHYHLENIKMKTWTKKNCCWGLIFCIICTRNTYEHKHTIYIQRCILQTYIYTRYGWVFLFHIVPFRTLPPTPHGTKFSPAPPQSCHFIPMAALVLVGMYVCSTYIVPT